MLASMWRVGTAVLANERLSTFRRDTRKSRPTKMLSGVGRHTRCGRSRKGVQHARRRPRRRPSQNVATLRRVRMISDLCTSGPGAALRGRVPCPAGMWSPQRHSSCTISSSVRSASCAMFRAQSSTFAQSWWYRIRLICCRSAISDPAASCRWITCLVVDNTLMTFGERCFRWRECAWHTEDFEHLTRFRRLPFAAPFMLCEKFFFAFLCRSRASASSQLCLAACGYHGVG
jgi:hypothetical protein